MSAEALPPRVARVRDAHARATLMLLKDLFLAAAAGGAGYGVFTGYRLDYLGHFLGGFGGTLLILGTFLFVSRRPLGWELVAGVLIAIAAGAGTEATIFRLAIFDGIDFCNQSLGAILAGICVLGHDGGPRAGLATFTAAIPILALGFFFAFA